MMQKPGDRRDEVLDGQRAKAMRRKIAERFAAVAFAPALLFLPQLTGSVTTMMDAFPSAYARDGDRAMDASKDDNGEERYASNLWTHIGRTRGGVTVHDTDGAQPGLTLYSSGHGARAVLVDMEGRLIHEWYRPFHDIWDESAAVRNPVREDLIYFRKARALSNGDLLAIYIGYGHRPWGYGMAKLDKDSNVIWKNLDRFHHDFDIGEDGRVYGLTHSFRDDPIGNHDHLPRPVLEDFLVILSPDDGRTLSKISVLEALQRSRYGRELWRIFHFTLRDPLHTNSVDVLTERTAGLLRAKVPVAAAGQVLLSFRELDGGTIALLDVDKKQVVWAISGSWKSQHDPDILPNGNILMFDNLGDFGPGGSRVIEVDPATTGVVWSYGGTADRPLYSPWRAAQELLPNGNILITESTGARILEINRRGDIVWEYINPVRGRSDGSAAPIVSWASRLKPVVAAGVLRAIHPLPTLIAERHPPDR